MSPARPTDDDPGAGLWSVEAEQSVLGALLLFPETGGALDATRLGSADFHEERHRLIWSATARCRERDGDADMISVFELLRAEGADEYCGGLAYLNELCGSVVSAGHAARHAQIVKDKAQRRRLVALGQAVRLVAAEAQDAKVLRGRISALSDELLRVTDGPVAQRIALEWASDQPDELQAPPQLVEGVLTAGGMSLFYGESNSGKSYLAIHLAICVSLGLPWLGRRTQRGAVLYVAAEGAWSIRLRLAAYRKHYGQQVGRFGLIPQALSLVDPSADVGDLISLIEAKRDELGEPIVLVVVDTVARVMGGGDENAAQDMGRLVTAGDRIRQSTGAHLLYIHHAGKDASRGARGHSSLRAALDTEIEVTADEPTKTHTAQVTKQRDLASKGDRLAGRFVSVDLGVDQWNNAVTACAVVEAEGVDEGNKPRRLTPTQRAVLAYLQGQAAGVRPPVVVGALEKQGIGRASIYRGINDLRMAGLVTDTLGLLYVPKE